MIIWKMEYKINISLDSIGSEKTESRRRRRRDNELAVAMQIGRTTTI